MNEYQRHPDRCQRVIEDGTLTIRIDEQLAKWSVWLVGELDDANADTVDAQLQRLDGDKRISLDLSRLGFMGAAGIEVLVRLANANRSVEVVHPSAPVERLLSTCGLDSAEHPWLAEAPSNSDLAGAMGRLGGGAMGRGGGHAWPLLHV